MNQAQTKLAPYLIGSLWLLVVMIFLMIILGGVTRLTGSGLSMVEWHPLTGILPPLNEAQWLAEFGRYKTSPEFLKIHPDMTMLEFQSIFWLEYLHRLWGRALGIVLLTPTIMVFLSSSFYHMRGRILLLWLLGGSQGLLGWYMVKSGLINDPHVSPYRLAAHLLLGFGIFWAAINTALIVQTKQPSQEYSSKQLRVLLRRSRWGLGLILCTVAVGAFVAGLKAGLIYNTFPKMGETWIPAEIFFHSPFWVNFTENAATVQFIHRALATLTLFYLLWFAYSTQKMRIPNSVLKSTLLLVSLVIVQYLLGILTLLYRVPVLLGTAHQGTALLLFATLVYMHFQTRIMRN